jgi:hypothetical protein
MIRYATKGFISALLPVVAGLTFSLAHGPIVYNLWSHLKIKAGKSEGTAPKHVKKPRPKKRVKKILRVYAHINPFHNLDVKSDQDK